VRSLIGPIVCGDAIDICDGEILTGSARQEHQLEIWDLGTGQCVTELDWNADLESTDGKQC
jgi:hypothetical protein